MIPLNTNFWTKRNIFLIVILYLTGTGQMIPGDNTLGILSESHQKVFCRIKEGQVNGTVPTPIFDSTLCSVRKWDGNRSRNVLVPQHFSGQEWTYGCRIYPRCPIRRVSRQTNGVHLLLLLLRHFGLRRRRPVLNSSLRVSTPSGTVRLGRRFRVRDEEFDVQCP